jgi:hypothetical protein
MKPMLESVSEMADDSQFPLGVGVTACLIDYPSYEFQYSSDKGTHWHHALLFNLCKICRHRIGHLPIFAMRRIFAASSAA